MRPRTVSLCPNPLPQVLVEQVYATLKYSARFNGKSDI